MFGFFNTKSKKFFSEQEKNAIVTAIQGAELNTSGEIRVHVEDRCIRGDVMRCATKVFRKLKIEKTAQRNGVLFYFTLRTNRFAILGDQGIDNAVSDDFWEEVRDVLQEYFLKEEFAKGLTEGIRLTGIKLKEYFPYQSDDVNELSDDISFG